MLCGLATAFGTRPFVNPMEAGLVAVTLSGESPRPFAEPTAVVAREGSFVKAIPGAGDEGGDLCVFASDFEWLL